MEGDDGGGYRVGKKIYNGNELKEVGWPSLKDLYGFVRRIEVRKRCTTRQ